MAKARKLIKKAFDIVVRGTIEQRTYLCENHFEYFCVYYFQKYFKYPIAEFHWDLYDDCEKLVKNELEEVAWIIFREGAKTSIAKMFVLWCICYKKKQYINYDCYDKLNAGQALFDVVVELQTNTKIINDFGQLFYKRKHKDQQEEAKRKTINEFITENGVKVEAFSTQKSTRGRLYREIRPDLFIFDDVETNITKESYPLTHKIKAHIDEARSGLGVNGSIITLGNYITEDGVIDYVLKSCENNPKAIARNIPVVDPKTGKIAWTGKYVKTNARAITVNAKIDNPLKRKVSLQAKKASLNAGGKKIYETEMLNDPEKSGDLEFDRKIIEELIDNTCEPDKIISKIKFWGKYNAKHRYGIGGDTSEGIGLDAQALVLIDFDLRPCKVIATFQDNKMDPATFGHVMARVGNKFGECIVAPELNNTGNSTLTELRGTELNYENIYIKQVFHKTKRDDADEYGWRSTGGNRWTIISALVDAVESGDLLILDEDLLLECKYFKKRDVSILKPEEGMTRHFDKLIACAIAWEMRKYAEKSLKAQKEDPENSKYFRKKRRKKQ